MSVQTFLRMRPTVASDRKLGNSEIEYSTTPGCFLLSDKKKSYKGFRDILLPGISNAEVFTTCLLSGGSQDESSVMKSILQMGQTGCVFTYGHTGAGKTHTVFGYRGEPGLYQLAADQLCSAAASASTPDDPVFVAVRFSQLYQKTVQDLLSQSGPGIPGGKNSRPCY